MLLLFLYLWVPLLQHSLDEWTNNYNTFKRRLDKKSMLPSRCSADWCYTYPEEQGGQNGLVPVPPEAADTLQTAFYPDGAELMRVTPLWFSEAVGKLVQGIEAPIPVVDIHNVWDVFSSILSLIKAYDQSWLSNPSNDPSLTISARAFNEN
ncbi:hypothetical protein VP01_2566g2 [Puccinia sorghi]|uniref:Uncharacterized protein n=1 Tax=Puccinia sorghi TaxID=27349 RepID=A0A0L6V6W1_9BASI|nr:hypothetical protein VP01_2566g2 [Puccinia sorghi]